MQLGMAHVSDLLQSFSGSYVLAIASYNAGAGRINQWIGQYGDPRTTPDGMVDWIERIPFNETRNYVQRVLENAVVYDLMNPTRAQSQGEARLSWYLGKQRPG